MSILSIIESWKGVLLQLYNFNSNILGSWLWKFSAQPCILSCCMSRLSAQKTCWQWSNQQPDLCLLFLPVTVLRVFWYDCYQWKRMEYILDKLASTKQKGKSIGFRVTKSCSIPNRLLDSGSANFKFVNSEWNLQPTFWPTSVSRLFVAFLLCHYPCWNKWNKGLRIYAAKLNETTWDVQHALLLRYDG